MDFLKQSKISNDRLCCLVPQFIKPIMTFLQAHLIRDWLLEDCCFLASTVFSSFTDESQQLVYIVFIMKLCKLMGDSLSYSQGVQQTCCSTQNTEKMSNNIWNTRQTPPYLSITGAKRSTCIWIIMVLKNILFEMFHCLLTPGTLTALFLLAKWVWV